MTYLGCDIGGTTGRVSVFKNRNDTEPIAETSFEVTQTTEEEEGDFTEDYRQLLESCQMLMDQHGPIAGVGLAVAGKVDAARRTLTGAGNLGHWAHHPIVENLEYDLGTHVMLGNDAEAGAMADATYGLAANAFPRVDFIEMIWGTGIGGCCIRYGNVERFISIPGEPGHLCVMPGDGAHECGCGQRGCLEAYASGKNILRYLGKPAEELDEGEWLEVAGWMAQGLRGVLTVQPVELVIFSGGLICKQPWLLEYIEGLLKHPMVGSPKLRISAFGEAAGTVGALALLNRF